MPVQPNPGPVSFLENNREADRKRSLGPIHCDVHDRVGSHPGCVPGRYDVPGNPLEPRTLRLRKVARELTTNLRPSNPALIGAGTDQEHVGIVSEQLCNGVDVFRSVPLGVAVERLANGLLCFAIQSHRASCSRSKIDRIRRVKATPQAIWDAITTPEWTEKYGYTGLADYELRAGGAYKMYSSEAMRKGGAEMGLEIPDVIIDGEVLESDPPRRLVQTWRMLMDPSLVGENTRLTWEIAEGENGVSTLTVTHDVTGAPHHGNLVAGGMESEGAGGGWAWVLSDLKTLLETGSPMAG